MNNKTFNIAIIGLGTVGCGLISLIKENNELLSKRTSRQWKIVGISARSKRKSRNIKNISQYTWYNDPLKMISNSNADVIVELIGGSGDPAYSIAKESIGKNIPFVSANKALIAEHGKELITSSENNGTILRFEAAIAGAIPIVKVMQESLVANKITSISGIFNGTANFILSEMEENSLDFSDALSLAQSKGYAEADPSMDIDGTDTVHKLAIISAIAYGNPINIRNTFMEGIEKIGSEEIKIFKEFGFQVRLVGVSRCNNNKLYQAVYPALVKNSHPFASIYGVNNAVIIDGNYCSKITLEGLGAGAKATASSVAADLMSIALGRKSSSMFSAREVSKRKAIENFQFEKISIKLFNFFLILKIKDELGALLAITKILLNNNISLKTVHQYEKTGKERFVRIVFITHLCSDNSLFAAIKEIEKLKVNAGKAKTFRIFQE